MYRIPRGEGGRQSSPFECMRVCVWHPADVSAIGACSSCEGCVCVFVCAHRVKPSAGTSTAIHLGPFPPRLQLMFYSFLYHHTRRTYVCSSTVGCLRTFAAKWVCFVFLSCVLTVPPA